jgi:hypothetical protein
LHAARGAFPAALLQSRSSRQAAFSSSKFFVSSCNLPARPLCFNHSVLPCAYSSYSPPPFLRRWVFLNICSLFTFCYSFPSRAAFVFIYTVPDIDIYGFRFILRLLRVPMTVITEQREICSRHCHGSFCYEHDLNLFLINEIHGDISLNKETQTCAIRQVSDTCNRAESIIVQCN